MLSPSSLSAQARFLLCAALFSAVAALFVVVLVMTPRTPAHSSSEADGREQGRLALRAIEQYAAAASFIDMPINQPMPILRLRFGPAANDLMVIYSADSALYLKRGDMSPQLLVSGKMAVADVSFTKHVHPNGRDSVSVSFALDSDAPSGPRQFIQAVGRLAARVVNAATFDSDIRASSTNTYKIGAVAQEWQSVNNTVFFGNSSNVGIGGTPASSTVKLQVFGGNISLDAAGAGVVMRSPHGYCYLLAVNNSGAPTRTSVTCP